MRVWPLALLLPLAACESEAEVSAEAQADVGVEVVFPGEGEVAAQEAAAQRAAEGITDENADDTLGDLEALIGAEDEQ